MPRYRRVNSFKIMNDYKTTVEHLRYVYVMADRKNKKFFSINQDKINNNISNSKMTNNEKNTLMMMINNRDYHQIYCYAKMLFNKYNKIYLQYEKRMSDIFMSIEDKTVFYA